jgi:hypothetical protein
MHEQPPIPRPETSPYTIHRGRRMAVRRERDPAEPEEEPGSREPVDEPPDLPRQPPVEDPFDAPGIGEPDRHDPIPRTPPRGDPPGRPPEAE